MNKFNIHVNKEESFLSNTIDHYYFNNNITFYTRITKIHNTLIIRSGIQIRKDLK